MKSYRIFVEKRPGFRVEAESLQEDLNENLGLHLHELRLLNVYDLFGFSEKLLEESRYRVFGEVQTDEVLDSWDAEGRKSLAVEYLPGQFDQRAASAVDCVRLIDPEAQVNIRSAKVLLFDDSVIRTVLRPGLSVPERLELLVYRAPESRAMAKFVKGRRIL